MTHLRRNVLASIVVLMLVAILGTNFIQLNSAHAAGATSAWANNGQQVQVNTDYPFYSLFVEGCNQNNQCFQKWYYTGYSRSFTTNGYWWKGSITIGVNYLAWYGFRGYNRYVSPSGSGTAVFNLSINGA